MKVFENTIKTVAIFSDDNNHRVLLRKTWDDDLKKAAFLMIFPASNDVSVTDLTTILVLNGLAKLGGYGSVDILNCFSKINANLSHKSESFNISENDEQILQSAMECDTIIIGWGTGGEGNKRIRARQMAILKLLEPYKEKIQATVDGRGKTCQHVLTPSLRSRFGITPFEFPKLTIANDGKPEETDKEPPDDDSEEQAEAETDESPSDVPQTDEPEKQSKNKRSKKDAQPA